MNAVVDEHTNAGHVLAHTVECWYVCRHVTSHK